MNGPKESVNILITRNPNFAKLPMRKSPMLTPRITKIPVKQINKLIKDKQHNYKIYHHKVLTDENVWG